MKQCEVPVVLFFFNRPDLALKTLERIAQVRPNKLYLFSDFGRNEAEIEVVLACRNEVEARINWDCEIIRNYAQQNRGVYQSIGLGARWVFEREPQAIFLEDDNLPEVTFFEYCSELLERYRRDTRVLWICGTSYLEEYAPPDGSDYMFTQHMLPCGWASWADKFHRMYDSDLKLLDAPDMIRRVALSYTNKALYRQQRYAFLGTKEKLTSSPRSASWDYQMAFSIRANSVYGIAPRYNQIKNIGADTRSTHGGTSTRKIMTRRFCNVETHALAFPLNHPQTVLPDERFERKIEKIILVPAAKRVVLIFVRLIKPLFGFHKYEHVTVEAIRKKLSRREGR